MRVSLEVERSEAAIQVRRVNSRTWRCGTQSGETPIARSGLQTTEADIVTAGEVAMMAP
jgi:hypothetical protein